MGKPYEGEPVEACRPPQSEEKPEVAKFSKAFQAYLDARAADEAMREAARKAAEKPPQQAV